MGGGPGKTWRLTLRLRRYAEIAGLGRAIFGHWRVRQAIDDASERIQNVHAECVGRCPRGGKTKRARCDDFRTEARRVRRERSEA